MKNITNQAPMWAVVRSEVVEWCTTKEEADRVKELLDKINDGDCVYTIDEIPSTEETI
jgi:hypothetical protein